MSEPRFLTVEQVGWLHQKTIERFGGLHGLRDSFLLEAEVIRLPCSLFPLTPVIAFGA